MAYHHQRGTEWIVCGGYGDHELGLEHTVLALLSQFVFVSCTNEGHGKHESVIEYLPVVLAQSRCVFEEREEREDMGA